MSEIKIEPKPRRSPLPYILGLLLVVAIAVAVWFIMERREADGTEAAPATAPPAAVDTTSGI
jgi:hypothetical protein